ncbi:Retrovirus-related Pol poly from transposon [Paramuricea clavata]|uniref:Retrovirus-related Pol poly from transposon n=1 Tax=Paramuricea clavata TaxID=317549 RepID=A0A6S7GR58_PARCT|nr:Retrovirus-related Pol poly from transposon [Paramuricea clavata]
MTVEMIENIAAEKQVYPASTEEQLEALQFELESLLYTKNETELENFAASVQIDGDIAGKSKIAITKLIQKYIEKQISEEGEMQAKLEWFRKAIDSLKPKPQTNSESELALSELQKQIDKLKEKQQAELQSMMEKLSQAKIDAQETQGKICVGIISTAGDYFSAPKVSAQQFLLRSLDLRNKVGFASKESDCEVRYDESLIHKTFIKSFETGLRDDVLAASLRQILRSPTLTDEDLMRPVNELASDHAERQSKLSSERRFAKVNSCEVEPAEATTKKDMDANKQILAEIREIRSEVESLKRQQACQNSGNGKEDRRGSYTSRGPTKSSRHRGRGCEACKKRGLGDSCRHCFACGEYGHIASECEKNNPEPRETRDGYPEHGTGFSRRNESVPSVQRLR